MSNKPSPIERLFLEAASGKLDNLEREVQIGRYRVDFLIRREMLVIELDGHDGHKTAEQRKYDATRQRFLQREGYTVIRFTGSEITNDVQKCVEEVIQFVKSASLQGFCENAIYIDWQFLSKSAASVTRYYSAEYPEKQFKSLQLSSILNEVARWLGLEGDFDVYLFSVPGWISESYIDINTLKFMDYCNGTFKIYEHQVEWLAVSLCEHLEKHRRRYDEVVLIADDRAYVPIVPPITKLIRYDNERTSMTGLNSISWQDIAYIIGTAIGLDHRYEL